MITAKCKTLKEDVQVDFLVNRGGWFGKTWLLLIGLGFDSVRLVIEADNAQDALDFYADSRHAHFTKIEGDDYDEDFTTFLGNCGDPHNLDDVRLLERCKVNYFAKKG